jgi:hypothetical protein
MSDNNKTILDLKRFPDAARTMVMPRPPRMTMNFDALELEFGELEPGETMVKKKAFDPRATRMAAPAMTHAIPRPAWKGEAGPGSGLETRMAPMPPPQLVPPLQPLPRLAPPPTMEARVPQKSAPTKLRPVLILAAGLLVIGLITVLPLSSPSASSQSNAAETTQEQVAPVTKKSRAPKAQPAAETVNETIETPTDTVKEDDSGSVETLVTEEQAATMLLSGRRADALALYRELARESDAPGIEAMIIVLSQKGSTP